MKKWAVLGGMLVLAASGIGWATLDASGEKVVATAGANIRVIEATRNGVAGYELEISWSGRRAEDIAVLHVSRAKNFPIPLGEFRPNDAYHAASLVWHAGESGSTRVFWRPPQRGAAFENDFCTAVLIFAPDRITVDHLSIPGARPVGWMLDPYKRKAGELDSSPQAVGPTVERAAAEFPDIPWLNTGEDNQVTKHVNIGTPCPCCEFHSEEQVASDREGLRIRWNIPSKR